MAFAELRVHPDHDAISTSYLKDEAELVSELCTHVDLSMKDRNKIECAARDIIKRLRRDQDNLSTIDAFLQEYELSSAEGVTLMRLAESLIRTPDTRTASFLLRDKLGSGDWAAHAGASHILVNTGTFGLRLSKAWIEMTGGPDATHLLVRLGDRIMLSAVRHAMTILGRHFVLGTSIEQAARQGQRPDAATAIYSYDMLGEAAITMADADRYFESYQQALKHLVKTRVASASLHDASSLSVKLSALHPRYEYARRDECVPHLVNQLKRLCVIAKSANVGLTIDAEEADRLEVSLLVFEALLKDPTLEGWEGLGLAIQAYQRRALPVIDWVCKSAKSNSRKITVRLVKGAYWDSEIKRAQEMGLESYPVFTRKENTDVSYLACARHLLEAGDVIYPQFATHNAHTTAAIVHMAGQRRDLEFQRLHGMSDGLHQYLSEQHSFKSRTYAPVGKHKELLPYLVRRLLENGANSSFVNQLLDETIDPAQLAKDPITIAETNELKIHPAIPAPRDHLDESRQSAKGLDLTHASTAFEISQIPLPHSAYASGRSNGEASIGESLIVLSPTDLSQVGEQRLSTEVDIEKALAACKTSAWPQRPAAERANALRSAAILLEARAQNFMALCVAEAGKTWKDADAEVREAVDFLRYYADQAERKDVRVLTPLGIIACISPWNFPLAIFLGQVSAALSVGNCVIAKPAEQTPLIAYEAITLMHEAGIPMDALHLTLGDGTLGAALVSHPQISGICFTGSTQTAKRIAASLSETERADTPFIAETGGINAMIVDSTALLEQAVQDTLDSAFQSAGQRCSACRIVCIQEEIADSFIKLLQGAMAELKTGHPKDLSTDIGPVIDQDAKARITAHIEALRRVYPVIGQGRTANGLDGYFIEPIAFELNSISDLREEIFGPVLHLVRYKASEFDAVIGEINAMGFGLTMGLHSRIDTRIDEVARKAKVGNLYINRNQIGAVVGVQPFGGQGLSGTGPKAGGPNYLKRLCRTSASSEEESFRQTIALPGPTGEDNTLSYHPRGRLLCLGGDTPDVLQAQLQRVEATGNTAVSTSHLSNEAALDLIDSDIDGVVADGAIRALAADKLATRVGAILPLLSARDPVERYYLERVITVDTTAAGGNASLLAMA